jgi:hypothetical protein
LLVESGKGRRKKAAQVRNPDCGVRLTPLVSQEAACFVKNSLIFAALFLGWVATIMHHQNKQPD